MAPAGRVGHETFQGLPGTVHQPESHFFDQPGAIPFLGEALLRGGEDAGQPHEDHVLENVCADILGSAPNVLLFELDHPSADLGLQLSSSL